MSQYKGLVTCSNCGKNYDWREHEGNCPNCHKGVDLAELGESGPYVQANSLAIAGFQTKLTINIEEDRTESGLVVIAPAQEVAARIERNTLIVYPRPPEPKANNMPEGMNVNVAGNVSGNVDVAGGNITKVGNISGSSNVAIGEGATVNVNTEAIESVLDITVLVPRALKRLTITGHGFVFFDEDTLVSDYRLTCDGNGILTSRGGTFDSRVTLQNLGDRTLKFQPDSCEADVMKDGENISVI